MVRRSNEPLEDREYPDEADLEGESSDRVLPCPECGGAVYEDAPQCPHCGAALPDDLESWRPHGRWYFRGGKYLAKVLALNWLAWVVLGLLALLAAGLARIHK
jgi:hypothetical protein